MFFKFSDNNYLTGFKATNRFILSTRRHGTISTRVVIAEGEIYARKINKYSRLHYINIFKQ